MPSGIPVLEVPDTDILANGTADPSADVATQARLAAESAAHPDPKENDARSAAGPRVRRNLDLRRPQSRLPAIDRLEGFLPDGPSLYRRVLVPAIIHGGAVPTWLYAGMGPFHQARRLPQGFWSA